MAPKNHRHRPFHGPFCFQDFLSSTTTTLRRRNNSLRTRGFHVHPLAAKIFITPTTRHTTVACASSISGVDFLTETNLDPTVASATTTAPSFDPVLNVPAFGAFLLITVIFGLLQFRMAQIGDAADQRQEALERVRTVKALELSGGGEAVSPEEVQETLMEYRTALEEVERLRTIVPGVVRIAAPPSESLSRERMEENVVAAKQFLNLDIQSTLPDNEKPATPKGAEKTGGLSPILGVLLGVVAFTQITLLALLVADPAALEKVLDYLSQL